MKLNEWQQSKKLTEAAEHLRKHDTFSRLYDMLQEESPLKSPLSPQGVTADDRSYRLGLLEGYEMCLKNIRMTWTKPSKSLPEIKSTYAPPEE